MTAHPHAVPPGLAVGAALGLVPLGQQRNSVPHRGGLRSLQTIAPHSAAYSREVENGLRSIRAIYLVTPRFARALTF